MYSLIFREVPLGSPLFLLKLRKIVEEETPFKLQIQHLIKVQMLAKAVADTGNKLCYEGFIVNVPISSLSSTVQFFLSYLCIKS